MKVLFFGMSLFSAFLSGYFFFKHGWPFHSLSAVVGLLAALLFFALGLLWQLLEPAGGRPSEPKG